MPAGSDQQPGASLPVTFRPLGVRIAVVVLGVLMFGVVAVTWFAFPQHTRDQFTLFQRLTLVGFGLAAAAGGYALARSRVEARPDGLVAVNGYRAHHYPWAEVTGVTLRAGGPWAILELADGSTAPAMGIQGSDGNRAVAQVKALRVIMRSREDGGGS